MSNKTINELFGELIESYNYSGHSGYDDGNLNLATWSKLSHSIARRLWLWCPIECPTILMAQIQIDLNYTCNHKIDLTYEDPLKKLQEILEKYER